MGKNKKTKKQETYEEKPKTKIEYMQGTSFDVTASEDVKCSVSNNTESRQEEDNKVINIEEIDKPDNNSTMENVEEDFIEVKRERTMNSKSKHGKFRAANDLLGTVQLKKGTDFNIPKSSGSNATYSGNFRDKGKTDYKPSKNEISVSSETSRSSDSDHLNSKQNQMKSDRKKTAVSNFRSTSSDRSFNKSGPSVNKLFDEWLALMDEKFFEKQENSNVIEVFGDLFTASDEYSLGHCVAEDMNMGSGIATTFRSMFKQVADLLNQGQTQGGLAVLEDKGRFIYYLVTKPFSNGKPTYETLFRSLVKMQYHIMNNNVKKVALPQIGCGLDNLDWNKVKPMLQFIFGEINVEIKIYKFQKDPYASTPINKHKKSRVVNVLKPIKEIENYTIIIYLCSVENFESDIMHDLDEKFRILKDYRIANRKVGTAIRTKNHQGDYILYGVVVKDKKNDKIDYRHFQTGLSQINKDNKNDQFEYVALQAFQEPTDDKVVTKLVNLMRNTLYLVDVYICWPKNLERYAPPEAQYN